MAWCEANGVHFLFGLAKNDRLIAEINTSPFRGPWRLVYNLFFVNSAHAENGGGSMLAIIGWSVAALLGLILLIIQWS
jgi:hypothetical protein